MTAQPKGYDWDRVMTRAPDGVSVPAIVVSYQTGPLLFDCLHALLADPDIAQVVVVDNGNPVEVQQKLEDLWQMAENLKVVGEGINRGFAAGVNLGVEHASGDRYLVINPDALLRPGSVAALEAARAGGVEPMVVGGKIYGGDGIEQRGGRRRRLTLGVAVATFLGLSRLPVVGRSFPNLNLNLQRPPDGPVPMGAVSGALMYLSREGFAKLGGFDDGYFLHVEDLDLCRRAEVEGGDVIYTPDAGAYHFGSTSDVPAVRVERHKAAGLRRYLSKFSSSWAERAVGWLLGPLIWFVLVVRALVRG